MSSLAASRADNFYFPPDWRPEYGGISKFAGSKGANQYQQYGIIRFEIPFDAWCLGCNRHVGKGTRFNAKKEKSGNYFSTTIWAFTMKCASCDIKFVIKTNPKEMTYDYVEGLRKMEQDFVPDHDDSIIEATSDEVRAELVTNPMFRLQHEKEDQVKAMTMNERMEALVDVQTTNWTRDYDMNSAMRARVRTKKSRDKELLEEGRSVGLNIPLVEPSDLDAVSTKTASIMKSRVFQTKERVKMTIIQSESIFGETTAETKKRKGCSFISSNAANAKRAQRSISKQAVARIDTTKLKIASPKFVSEKAVSLVVKTSRFSSASSSSPELPTSALGLISTYDCTDDDEDV